MRPMISGLLAGIATLALAPARAGVITQNFTVTVSPAANLDVSHAEADAFFPASAPAAQFNPAEGTLTSVSMSLTGAVTYSLSGPGSALADKITEISVRAAGINFAEQDQSQTGQINLNLAGSVPRLGTPASFALPPFIGTGSVTPGLFVFARPLCEMSCTATFGTVSPLSGTLTYTFTPAVSAVPEPTSGLVLLAGLAGLGMALRTRRA